MKSELFRLRILDAITDSYEFKKVKSVFVNKFKYGLGVNGEFTNSQIQLTTKEFDELVMFKQIPIPFHQSIGLALQFYEEYRLKAKVNLMVEVVEKAK